MTAIPAAWTPIAAGMYDDQRGGVHLVITEILAAAGYPDTPRNRATLLAAAREGLADLGVTIVEEPR